MHPFLATKTRIALYLLAWLPIAGLLKFPLQFSSGLSFREGLLVMVPLSLVYSFICLSPWYLCRVLPIGQRNIWKVVKSHVAAGVVASLFWVVLAKGLALLMSRWDAPMDPKLSRNLPTIFIVGFLLYMLAVSLHYVFLSYQDSRDAEMRVNEARMFAREAELKALKAQINPHFLFNSLNSISALTMADPARAREMCIRLSDFLRSTLSLGDKETIDFSEELALARTYLSVEQIRFGSRLRLQENVEALCGSFPVPPLVMQPLVENAIKHGVAGLVEGGDIRLEAHVRNGRLHLSVENEFDSDAPTPRRSGVGLANIRGRLRARYENRARLDTAINGNHFVAELSLPSEEHPRV